MNSQYDNSISKLGSFRISNFALNFLQGLILILSIFVVLYLFIVTPSQIKGFSMDPTLMDSDLVLSNKLVNWIGESEFGKAINLDYKRGDIVVFQKPGLNDSIKRIIALPGERVAIRDGFVYVNNKQILEGYLLPATFTKGSTFIEDGGESKEVQEGEFFVLGDNRANSIDSRNSEIGFVKKEWLKGKVVIKYWPLNDLQIINSGKIEFLN